jgi:hypothetical protein
MMMMTSERRVTHPSERTVLVLPEHWSSAGLLAMLLERGLDTQVAPTLRTAILNTPLERRVPPGIVLLELDALSNGDADVLTALAEVSIRPKLLLLAHAATELPAGPWDRVLRRPVSLAEIAAALEDMARPAKGVAWLEHRGVVSTGPKFRGTLGLPWPRIVCQVCGGSRHQEMPRADEEQAVVVVDLLSFVVQHATHPALIAR